MPLKYGLFFSDENKKANVPVESKWQSGQFPTCRKPACHLLCSGMCQAGLQNLAQSAAINSARQACGVAITDAVMKL
jgi:hypothetical protein